MKTTTKTKKTATATKPAATPTLSLWEARDFRDGYVEGYLLTEPGDLDRPVLMVFAPNCEQPTALANARRIMSGMSGWDVADAPVTLLSVYGQPGDRLPMPSFVYSLSCRPMPDEGNEPVDIEPREPHPFCAIRLAEMLARQPGRKDRVRQR